MTSWSKKKLLVIVEQVTCKQLLICGSKCILTSFRVVLHVRKRFSLKLQILLKTCWFLEGKTYPSVTLKQFCDNFFNSLFQNSFTMFCMQILVSPAAHSVQNQLVSRCHGTLQLHFETVFNRCIDCI